MHDDDQLHFAKGLATRMARDEEVVAQIQNHSDSQVMHGHFPKKVIDLVLDAMNDNEKLSMDILSNEKTQHAFSLIILKMLRNSTDQLLTSFTAGK